MTELSGHVQDFGLVALVRFLAESGRNGCLKISRQSWTGEVVFDHGRLAASIGEECGEAALELIALALSDGTFAYTDGPPGAQLPGDTGGFPLQQALEWFSPRSPLGGANVSLGAVPRVADLPAEAIQREVALTRSELALLLNVDGCRSIAQILNGNRSLRSVYALTRLGDLGVIDLAPTGEAPPVYSANGLTEQDTPSAPPPEPPTDEFAPPPLGETGRTIVFRYLLSTIVVCALLVLGAQSIIQAVRVDGRSMLPGLQTGQFLLINRAAYFHVDGSPLAGMVPAPAHGATRYLFGGPRRGDVVVFPSTGKSDSELILRIIALPGEHVRIEQGTVFVDERSLAEPYTLPAADLDTYPGDGQSISIPDDSYFVLSDNRAIRQDSRGGWFVRGDDLIGRAWLTYWPPALWEVFAQPAQMEALAARTDARLPISTDAVPALAAVNVTTAPPAVLTPPSPKPTATPIISVVGALLDGAIKNQPGWLSDPAGPVTLDGAGYRMTVQLTNRFVAVAAPVVGTYMDVIVTARFHKIGGPPGGGYGIIVRDQTPEIRDGTTQIGRFYVAEAGDRGEIGLWQREDDHWVDLVPWTPSEAVHVGGTTNELTLRAEGERLTFLVNGIQQATVSGAVLRGGGVGAFIGGDLNQVVLDRFTVQLPSAPTPP